MESNRHATEHAAFEPSKDDSNRHRKRDISESNYSCRDVDILIEHRESMRATVFGMTHL